MAPAPSTSSSKRQARLLGAAILVVGVLSASFAYYLQTSRVAPGIEAGDSNRIALGRALYERNCASCHGVRLEGQPDWQSRLPNDRMPAPPHDDTGHTWHHPDQMLFDITKYGLVPPNAPSGYQSDMPAFQTLLSDDEIRAVLAYIRSHWSSKVMQWRADALGNPQRP